MLCARGLRLPLPAPLGEQTVLCSHEALRECLTDDRVGGEADRMSYCEVYKFADRHMHLSRAMQRRELTQI